MRKIIKYNDFKGKGKTNFLKYTYLEQKRSSHEHKYALNTHIFLGVPNPGGYLKNLKSKGVPRSLGVPNFFGGT